MFEIIHELQQASEISSGKFPRAEKNYVRQTLTKAEIISELFQRLK